MNLNLGLDAAALEHRRKFVTASDASKLMEGRWREVYASKMGAPDDDLSNELRVQLGSFTEPFNLAWCWKQTGREVIYYSDNPVCKAAWQLIHGGKRSGPNAIYVLTEFQHSMQYPFMACSLDGMTTTAQGYPCPIDAKQVGQAGDAMIQRYTAAGVHQATVMGCDWWALSVLVGNSRWELIEQEVDPLYQAELIATEREFWSFVEAGEEPEDRTPGAAPPKPQPKLRVVQLEDEFRDAWPNWAGDMLPEIKRFAETDGAAKINGMARGRIKDLLPDDVGTLTRGLFKLSRTKAGAITMVMQKGEGDDDA